MRIRIALVALAVVAVGLVVLCYHGRSLWVPAVQMVIGKKTVGDVLASAGEGARARMRPHFERAGVDYPPAQVTLVACKQEATLEVWAASEKATPRRTREYSIRGLSGGPGPKLREGDRQVPEGIYRIEGLNPNSSFHLSLKLNYPNAFDLEHAQAEGRMQPGSNIFIHGKTASVGCLAMGDEAIEELFTLTADVGIGHVTVLIAPHDPRHTPLDATGFAPWVADLYDDLHHAFSAYTDGTGL